MNEDKSGTQENEQIPVRDKTALNDGATSRGICNSILNLVHLKIILSSVLIYFKSKIKRKRFILSTSYFKVFDASAINYLPLGHIFDIMFS